MTTRRSDDPLDTHLLRIFCLLIAERSVSRTALKLNQTQPAVSLALKRLRQLPIITRALFEQQQNFHAGRVAHRLACAR